MLPVWVELFQLHNLWALNSRCYLKVRLIVNIEELTNHDCEHV